MGRKRVIRLTGSMPGHYELGPTLVAVPQPIEAGGSLAGSDYYIITLKQGDGVYKLTVNWSRHKWGKGQVITETESGEMVFPHKVVLQIATYLERVQAQKRHERAVKATYTRKVKGVVPFAKKQVQS